MVKLTEFDKIHRDSKGWITVARKQENYTQRHYRYDQIAAGAEELIADTNAFYSQNTFLQPTRRLEYIKELKALYIDVDCPKVGFMKDAALYLIQEELIKTNKIPPPSTIIDSGTGLWLKWHIEWAPAQALPLWNAIMQYLYDQLEEFGADRGCLDATRVSRFENTVNSKNGATVKIVESNDITYTLRHIQSEYLPQLPLDWQNNSEYTIKRKKGRKTKVTALLTWHSLHYARLCDLAKLVELRNGDMEGCTEYTLFLYRYWSACYKSDTDDALQDALELNQKFKKPMPERRVIIDTKSAEKAAAKWIAGEKVKWKGLEKRAGYNYKTESIIELLQITSEEQRHMRTLIGSSEKNRRQKERRKAERRAENGKTERETQTALKLSQVKELRDKGLKQKEIANQLGISAEPQRFTYGRFFVQDFYFVYDYDPEAGTASRLYRFLNNQCERYHPRSDSWQPSPGQWCIIIGEDCFYDEIEPEVAAKLTITIRV
ncbi:DNA-binding response regulator [Aduncisulcus paluster]|uniref:DNA-binding response regulator n=1 Tax=Aduncisulcus paluster TaxID=2918883 RepID=A0ABQ5KDT6_9EUKA|nr:DNA-binding response regulator [Aduncisulcus paluster]